MRLLSKTKPKDQHELDAHPVVRAFFAGRLEETAPETAKAAHEILYRHYAAAEPGLPDTLEEMQPLFHAIKHGVKAGQRAGEIMNYLSGRIIARKTYRIYIMRAWSIWLALIDYLANFFKVPWRVPHRDLNPARRRGC